MPVVPSRAVSEFDPFDPVTGGVAVPGGVAVTAGVGDDSGFMSERTPNTPSTSASPEADSPRLRLAGTNAGPVTDEERRLLDLRAGLVRARGLQTADAAMIRERLERAGRKDPIEVATGTDAFTRTSADLDAMLARIDARLAELDAVRGAAIEIDPNASDLLKRP